jgi:antitoxin (DNA-binding transcriptional repressor) of toxin-antitoxin stability system
MRQVSLREFRTRGAQALKSVPNGETILLSGQKGPAYFLIPVQGDIAAEEGDLRRAVGKASLRDYAKAAAAYPVSDKEIEEEISAVRSSRRARRESRNR